KPGKARPLGEFQELWWKIGAVPVGSLRARKPVHTLRRNCRSAAMLSTAASTTIPPADDREMRIQALVEQLRPAAERSLRTTADARVDNPAQHVSGAIEYKPRDAGQQLAAPAPQPGLESRKKGATSVAVSTAPTAAAPPNSPTPSPATS